MNVLPVGVVRVAVDLHDAVRRLARRTNVNASKTLSVPSHMYRQSPLRRASGRNVSAYRAADRRVRARRAATTRSYVARELVDVGRRGAEAHGRRRASAAPLLQDLAAAAARLIAAKPWPPLVTTSPLKWTSMSSQRANSRSIAAWIDRVGVLDAAERLVGEHHAEAERVVGGVALPHGDLVRGRPAGAAWPARRSTARRARRRSPRSAWSPPPTPG